MLQPLLIPALKIAAPLVLRYVLTWYLRRRIADMLTRREYLDVWVAVLNRITSNRPPR